MSLTRKMLKAMSIEEEKIDQIIEAHSETVEALKAERDGFKEDAEKFADLQKELKELRENGDANNPYKAKYDALKTEFDNYKADEEAKATKRSKEEAYKALLKECGVADKRIAAVTKVADIDSIELDESGKIKEAAALKKSIKEEWGEFIPTEGTEGAKTTKPPANNGGKMSKDEIMAIKDTAQRQQAMLDNKELFI